MPPPDDSRLCGEVNFKKESRPLIAFEIMEKFKGPTLFRADCMWALN